MAPTLQQLAIHYFVFVLFCAHYVTEKLVYHALDQHGGEFTTLAANL